MVAIDASSGIQVGTNRAWRRCEDLGLPRGIVITGIDKDNADFDGILQSVQDVWGNRCVPVVLPTGDGVVDVLGATDVPADMAERVAALKQSLVESAAETDDEMLEKFFGDEPLSAEEIGNGLRSAVANSSLVPVFCHSSQE